MSELISGKGALIALANGEEVQIREPSGDKWHDPRLWTVGELLRWNGEFRLKPRTIKLNGIEVPRPEKATAAYSSNGSVVIVMDTNEDAEKFATALRSIFNESN